MTITEASDVNTVLRWAMAAVMGRKPEHWPGHPVSDADATAAAKRLTARAQKTLMAGLRPEQVELYRPAAGMETGRAEHAAAAREERAASPAAADVPAGSRVKPKENSMSFSFAAAGDRKTVMAQLAEIESDNEVAAKLTALLIEQLSVSGDHSSYQRGGAEYVPGWIVEASGHSGHGSPLTLSVSVKFAYFPVPQPQPETDNSDGEPAAGAGEG
jgi:hypothetical protein